MPSSDPNAKSSEEKKGQGKSEKSYLSAAVESIYPWGGSAAGTLRSSTPKPRDVSAGEGSGLKNHHGKGADHSTSYFKGFSKRRYTSDCPELNVRWFYAVDVSSSR